MKLPSKVLENAVEHLSLLPGVGKKSALRLALKLTHQEPQELLDFADAIRALATELNYCKTCYNISDHDTCEICATSSRNHKVICVVEDVRDVLAIESTHQFEGVYHVLGALISPMDGVGPADLTISELVQRVKDQGTEELIFALSANMEGETTAFYVYKQLQEVEVKMSAIARGIGVGDEIQYADELTLARSIKNRLPFDQSLKR